MRQHFLPNNCDSVFSQRVAASKWSEKELHLVHILLHKQRVYV